MTSENNQNQEVLRRERVGEILHKIQNEQHAPKKGPPPLEEKIRGYQALVDLKIQIGNEMRGIKPKKEKKKILNITKGKDLDRLNKSSQKPAQKPAFFRKILATQQTDEHPSKSGWGRWKNMTRKEFAVSAQNLIKRRNERDKILNVNAELERCENLGEFSEI